MNDEQVDTFLDSIVAAHLDAERAVPGTSSHRRRATAFTLRSLPLSEHDMAATLAAAVERLSGLEDHRQP